MGDALVVLDDVSVRVGRTPILTGVSLRLDPGEVVGIAGPNGAGKTTLLDVVATFTAPTAGGGTVLGARLGSPEVYGIRAHLGWAGHESGLYPELTLEENLRFFATIAGLAPATASDVLRLVGLEKAGGRRADRSSNGMRRRVDLARILMTRPRLVLLDEAQAGLDEAAEAIIDEIVGRARSIGGGAVLVSHDASRLGGRTDRLVQIDDGRMPA